MSKPVPTEGLLPAGGFDEIENLLRERTYTQHDPDDYLPPDAICDRERDYHANGQRFYHSRIDIEAADAIHSLGVALASQIQITNAERERAERLEAMYAKGKADAGREIADIGEPMYAYLHVAADGEILGASFATFPPEPCCRLEKYRRVSILEGPEPEDAEYDEPEWVATPAKADASTGGPVAWPDPDGHLFTDEMDAAVTAFQSVKYGIHKNCEKSGEIPDPEKVQRRAFAAGMQAYRKEWQSNHPTPHNAGVAEGVPPEEWFEDLAFAIVADLEDRPNDPFGVRTKVTRDRIRAALSARGKG